MQELVLNGERPRTPDTAPRVLLVSVTPLVGHSLALRLAEHASVRSVAHGSVAYDEVVRAFAPHVVIVDVTYLGGARAASAVGQRFSDDTLLLFIGYAHDGGAEESISQELGGLYNPSLEDILAAVRSVGQRVRDEAARSAPLVLVQSPSEPGHPAGSDATSGVHSQG